MKKTLGSILAFAAAAGLVWLVWFKPPPPEAPEPLVAPDVPVKLGKIATETLRSYVTAYGLVEAEPGAGARVAAPVAGVVALVKCAEGQRVESGALLFQLDSRAADVAADYAGKSLERQKKLGVGEGTSQKAFQEAEQQLASARAQQLLLQVRAPIAGVVARINVRAGEAADLTTVMAEVVDLDRLTVNASVPVAELNTVKEGQPVELFAGGADGAIAGKVALVGSQVDPKTGAGWVRVAVPASSGLRPGQFMKALIIVAEHKDCLAVPLASLARDANGAAKIALVEQDQAKLKAVKAGLRDGDWVEVEAEDLKPGMTVVTEGAYGLIMTERFATKIRAQ